MNELWVCWTMPRRLPSGDATLLSFLQPSEEAFFRSKWSGPIINIREAASVDVRRDARTFYIDLVARIGITKSADGRTFRDFMSRPGRCSAWWYHPVSFKDCESDSSFNSILAVFTIRKLCNEVGVNRLVLAGAPAEISEVLRQGYDITSLNSRAFPSQMWVVLRALAGRMLYAGALLRVWATVRNVRSRPKQHDFVFSAFWNWSLFWSEKSQTLVDRYFSNLPAVLRSMDYSIGWLVWMDSKRDVQYLRAAKEISILQAELGLRDIVKAFFDFGPAFAFFRVRKSHAFRNTFVEQTVDFWPIFEPKLLTGFLDSSIVQCELIATATERACVRCRPKVSFHFLEHFPVARAHYDGVRRSHASSVNVAIQHASYCHEKTFLFLNPSIEFNGHQDGHPVPHPDLVCAIGSFARDLFNECGYTGEQVIVTGSTRYGTIDLGPDEQSLQNTQRPVRILIVAALGFECELDLVDAACTAVQGLSNVKLLLRNHPLGRLDQHARFSMYSDQVQSTTGSLEEDLADADLILFTYSTAAEEAYLRGKIVWQWVPTGFNGSALAEVAEIPRFRSVGELRAGLIQYVQNPVRHPAPIEVRKRVLEQLFHSADGKAAYRIAAACAERIKVHEFTGV